MYVQFGDAYTYKISFIVDGNLVSPSSANITLLKTNADIQGGINKTALVIPSGATSVSYTISAGNNGNTDNTEPAIRYIIVAFVYDGQTHYIRDYYQLRGSLVVPVSANDVRSLLGFTSSEISDNQIDIFRAYDEVEADITSSLSNIVYTDTALLPYAQQAIKARAALNAMTFIEAQILQSEQADNTIYKRFSKVDFQSGFDRLNIMYQQAITALNGDDPANAVSVAPFLVVTGIDPVTGQ